MSTLSMGAPFHSTRIKIGLISKGARDPFVKRMDVGCIEQAEIKGIELLVRNTDDATFQSITTQQRFIEEMIQASVQAIVIAPSSSTLLIPPLLKANDKGIHIVNVGSPLDEEEKQKTGFTCVRVGPDNRKGGRLSAHDMTAALNGEGIVAILEGEKGQLNSIYRKEGFAEVMNQTRGIRIVETVHANWDSDIAEKEVERLLVQYPNIKGLFCVNDRMALGGLRALEKRKKTHSVIVSSYDNLRAARDEIRRGRIQSTIEQNPHLMGAKGIQAALDLIQGNPVPNYTPTAVELIDYRAVMLRT